MVWLIVIEIEGLLIGLDHHSSIRLWRIRRKISNGDISDIKATRYGDRNQVLVVVKGVRCISLIALVDRKNFV